MELLDEEKRRTITSQSIFDASLRLTHDHELLNSSIDEIKRTIMIDYNNELYKLYLRKIKDNSPLAYKQISIYDKYKDNIIEYRLKRVLEKKEKIKKRNKLDWEKIEEQYRNEELEHLKLLMKFKPSREVIYIKRANYNDIRLIRNYIRTISFVEGNINDDNIISKYRNIEFKLRSNHNYVVVETVIDNNENYGYIVNKRNYFDRMIIRIHDDNDLIMIDILPQGYLYDKLLSMFLKKIQ